MIDKTITHEEARKTMMVFESDDGYYRDRDKEHEVMASYITQQEQFAKDVARYFELNSRHDWDKYLTQTTEEMHERWALEEKLTKGVAK